MRGYCFFIFTLYLTLVACKQIQVGDASQRSTRDFTQTPDAVVKEEPLSFYGNAPFYDVAGERYTVLPTADGYKEQGVASWYGSQFHQKLTANREVYDMYAMTAAHKTLPLPSYVKVTNLANNQQITVRINDRGPFHSDRIIDLSYAAASKLGMAESGTAMVEVEAIHPAGIAPKHPAQMYLQIGAFGQLTNAAQLAQKISPMVIEPVEVYSDASQATTIHRVKIGPIHSMEQAYTISALLQARGYGQAIPLYLQQVA